MHMNDIEEGASLNEGDEVEFEPADSPKGPKATKVTKSFSDRINRIYMILYLSCFIL